MPVDLVDEQKIGTAVTQTFVDRILTISDGLAAKWTARWKNKTKKSFSNYLTNRYRRARQIRNLVYDTESGDLESLYIGTDLSSRSRNLNGYDLAQLLSASARKPEGAGRAHRPTLALIIRGGAGTGKSMLMRWLFVRLCDCNKRVPLLIELRDYNDTPPQDILELVRQEFSSHDSTISREQVELGLKKGLFSLLLDGLDEIDPEQEEEWHQRVTLLAKKYPLCPIVISGRPSQEMLSWSEFRIFDIAPLTNSKTEDLISKLAFDQIMKIKFIDECRSRLFKTHEEFLGNPLLATVMLITYSDNGRISNEMHEFYEDAFNALWIKHDARKEGFQRRRYCGLVKQKFQKLLSGFSASSYLRNTFSFREMDFEHHMEIAKRLTGVRVNSEDFRKDLTKSVSLCVMDGNFLRFAHRSFQEYFCALYILQQEDERAKEDMIAVSVRFETDNVLRILNSIDSDKFERCFSIPVLSTFLRDPDHVKLNGHELKAVRSFYKLEPSNEEIAAGLDAQVEMTRVGQGPSRLRLERLLDKDIRSLRKLEKQLSGRLAAQQSARGELHNRAAEE